jgi:hypothetical protein
MTRELITHKKTHTHTHTLCMYVYTYEYIISLPTHICTHTHTTPHKYRVGWTRKQVSLSRLSSFAPFLFVCHRHFLLSLLLDLVWFGFCTLIVCFLVRFAAFPVGIIFYVAFFYVAFFPGAYFALFSEQFFGFV